MEQECREKTLAEVIDSLPPRHRARKEFDKLLASAATEREACAKIADSVATDCVGSYNDEGDVGWLNFGLMTAEKIETAIRARGEEA